MRFVMLRLVNYIGVYNGLGLREVTINFPTNGNPITVIKGDNGSGKSTIMKSLSVFPDPNTAFIPDADASKEVVFSSNGITYYAKFVHKRNANGNREVTKAHLLRENEDLNPNGNVTSYKDIIFEELALDPNFESLSQLSLDDRGLADKKPAERKKFVNSILASMQAYNGIYKTISKKVASCKSLIGSITAKLNMIGDKNIQQQKLDDIEDQINRLQDDKDKAAIKLAEASYKLSEIDPDSQIQKEYRQKKSEYAKLNTEASRLQDQFANNNDQFTSLNGISIDSIDKQIQSISQTISSFRAEVATNRRWLEDIIASREDQIQEIDRKSARLQSLNNGVDYKNLCSMIDSIENSIQILQKKYSYDLTSITKDELRSARYAFNDILEVLEDIDRYDNDIIAVALGIIQSGNSYTPEAYDPIDIELIETEIRNLDAKICDVERDFKIIDVLKNRPEGCNLSKCFFINDALMTKSRYGDSTLDDNKKSINDLKDEYKRIINDEKRKAAVFYIQDKFSSLVRLINRNSSLLIKFGATLDIRDIAHNAVNLVFSKKSREYIAIMISNLDDESVIDQYTSYKESLDRFYEQKREYDSKIESITVLNADIQDMNNKLDELICDIESKNERIAVLDSSINNAQKNLDGLNRLRDFVIHYNTTIEALKKLTSEISSIEENISKINAIKDSIESSSKGIKKYSISLNSLMRRRDDISHSLRMADEYEKELASLNNEYTTLDLIRKYSSPTTGIQLVFMELYMGKIIGLANQLLSLLFNGRFTILPFVINESEFRIPCQGDGYQNDDISSMSAGQISMISMILSFSILYNSSTIYNIIKLDEIDGPLDDTNRAMFLDVLQRIMSIMHTEQCIMISHNTELDLDNTDIILLGSRENFYTNGNIIWSAF